MSQDINWLVYKLCLFVTVLCYWSINILWMTCSIGDTNDFQYNFIRFYIACGLILIFLRKYLSPTILLSVRKNICLWEGDLYQNVSWSIDWLTQWWNLLGLIRQSDVLDAFNLLTVLYKLDTAAEIAHICPAIIGRVDHRTYISRNIRKTNPNNNVLL